MKILFVATVDAHIKAFHLPTIHALKKLGNAVDVVANGTYSNDDIRQKFNLPFSRNPFSSAGWNCYKQLRKLLQENQYDVLSCHTPIASFLVRMAARDVPNLKIIYMAHGFHFYEGCALINKIVYKNVERIGAKHTDVLVTINQEDYKAACGFSLRKGGRVVYIPGMGIDYQEICSASVDRSAVLSEFGIPEDSKVLVSVGELNDNKNHAFVIHSLLSLFKKDPSLHYLICGDGTGRDNLEKLIAEHELSNQVHLAGFRTDRIDIVKACDVFVFPSKREGLPVSIMEAMACGKPVVASRIRGNRDLIQDGQNGFLYDLEDSVRFMECVTDCLNDKEEALKLGTQAQLDAAKYDRAIIEKQILSLYGLGGKL